MPRLKRSGGPAAADTRSLRLRAAWLYYGQSLTQQAIAERLGVSRPTVIRLLEAAVASSEVKFWIAEAPDDCVALALALEERLGLAEAIVVPGGGDARQSARIVGMALGGFLSGLRYENCRVGVGWGRTLSVSLASFRPATPEKAEVVSLLGGVVRPDIASPSEFAWRFAAALKADCYLMPAPLLVDSAETRIRLIEDCGLRPLFERGKGLDIALVGTGEAGPATSSLGAALLAAPDRRELIAAGAVCETLGTFLDAEGRDIDHPVNRRTMSLGLDVVGGAGHVILAAGGAHRAAAILATHRRLGVCTLVTDEAAATAILAASG